MNGARTERGVALAIVVWFLAAMSLLVAGIVYRARVDVHMAQVHAARAKVEAAGDGATMLMLANLAGGQRETRAEGQALGAEVRIGEQVVWVELVPVAGLVNLNGASELLLAGLFAGPGGVAQGDAQRLAATVVEWRSPGRGGGDIGGRRRFETVEDLLRVDGLNRTLLDNIRDYVAVIGDASLNWMAAPPALLEWFRERYPQQVAAAVARRERLADKVDGGRAGSPHEGGVLSLSGNFRVDATVIYGDQAWLRRTWVRMGSGSSNHSSLPWQVMRVEAARVRLGS